MLGTKRRARGVLELVLVAMATWLLVPATGAQAPQAPTFRSRADLVQVDVVVVDKDGSPVRGLMGADFTLLDRGRAQVVATFEEVTHARAEGAHRFAEAFPAIKIDVATNSTAQATRLIVLVVDDLHIYRERTDRAKDIARSVVGDLGTEASMAVLFTSGDHSTQVTEDRSTLLDAVETLKGRQSWRRPHQATDAQKGGRIDPEMSGEAALAVVARSQETSLQDFFDNMSQYRTLQNAARMLGSNDVRRKAFVLVSEGIGKDLSGLFGAMATPGDVPEGGLEYATGGGPAATTAIAPTEYHSLALIEMMESMRRSNVATYAIDPRGRVESKDLARECFPAPRPGLDPCFQGLTDWVSPVRQAQHGLEMMSAASGGFAVTNTDDFTSGLKRIVDDLDHYYLLGFYPSNPKGKGYRPLRVTVPGHPGWTLRFRRGYLPGDPPSEPKNADPLVALSAGVLPKADLPLRLTAIPFPGVGRMSRVVLALEVSAPVRELQEPDGRLRDELKYEVLVVDEKKNKVRSMGGLEGRLTLSPKAEAGPPPDLVAYQVRQNVDLAPGRYQLRVSAASAKLAKGGSVYLDVEVPDYSAPQAALSGLALGFADDARVPVAPPPRTPGSASVQPTITIPISLDRAFTPADVLNLHFEVTAGGAPTAFAGTIAVIDPGGRGARNFTPPTAERGPIDVRIPLNELPAGAYLLRVSLTGGTSRQVAFVVK